jgi:hypothetical protein
MDAHHFVVRNQSARLLRFHSPKARPFPARTEFYLLLQCSVRAKSEQCAPQNNAFGVTGGDLPHFNQFLLFLNDFDALSDVCPYVK